MERVSEYFFFGLSAESQARYTAKVTNAGLKSDPYANASECWVSEPPEWSDMFMFMTVTPTCSYPLNNWERSSR